MDLPLHEKCSKHFLFTHYRNVAVLLISRSDRKYMRLFTGADEIKYGKGNDTIGRYRCQIIIRVIMIFSFFPNLVMCAMC